MNYKKLVDWHSGFYNWVNRRHPHNGRRQNGFMGGFIFGERGQGKSTYCYKVMAKTYYHFNGYNNTVDEEDAYKEALRYMLYEPREFQRLTSYNKIKHIITPILCLDDASMHFGNMLHQTDNRMYSALMAQTATVRTAVTGFLITAPKRAHVAKFLRDYDDFKGEAFIDKGGETLSEKHHKENWNRKIRFYRWKWYPDEKKYNIKIPFQDKYSCCIPDEFYHPYEIRKNYFEVKYDIDEATRTGENRDIFIELRNELPSLKGYPDLKQIVNKWKDEKVELEQKDKIAKIQEQMRMDGLKKKINKFKINREMNEDKGIASVL